MAAGGPEGEGVATAAGGGAGEVPGGGAASEGDGTGTGIGIGIGTMPGPEGRALGMPPDGGIVDLSGPEGIAIEGGDFDPPAGLQTPYSSFICPIGHLISTFLQGFPSSVVA